LAYYQMIVSPDGNFRPALDRTGLEPIHITLWPPAKDKHPFPDEYLAVVAAGAQSLLTSYDNSSPNAHVRPHHSSTGPNALFDVDARYANQSGQTLTLIIKPADHDWIFSAFGGSLTTDVEARHLNIQIPQVDGQTMHWRAESNVFLETGPFERGR
jgi:hypothetical protein